jgi:transcriptional antiterminator NusG
MRELCPWYAITVKHQHEQAVRSALVFKGFETLAPTYRGCRHWSDRVKELDLPLFAGYVFSRFPYQERAKVLDTPCVAKVVNFGGHPAEIPNEEIAAIQAVVASRLPMRPWPYLKPGDRVRVERGPLRGLEGTILGEGRNLRLIIGVELLQRSMSVELEAGVVAPLRALWAAVSPGRIGGSKACEG